MFGWNKKVSNRLNRLIELQAQTISLSELKGMLYDTYETFYIWGRTEKENKALRRVQAYSVAGPGGRAMSGARYWTDEYVPEGYIILFNVDKGGFRTYPINKITQIEKDGELFKVQ
jgi:hypothetical protein